MAVCCTGNISAGSRVTPGGYAQIAEKDVGQFMLNDTRTVAEIESDLKKRGLETVIKYWDRCIG
jgi:hypothetical protein